MPLPIYGSQSSGLTQSNDDARQQGNRAIGYDPTALERALDWIGRQFSSNSAAKDPGPSGGSRVLEWIGRQFGGDPYAPGGAKNPKVTDPYDRSNPAVDAWFRSLYNSPTPFGQVPYGPPAPSRKPVTKISSADKLGDKVKATFNSPRLERYGPPEPYGPPAGFAPGADLPPYVQQTGSPFNLHEMPQFDLTGFPDPQGPPREREPEPLVVPAPEPFSYLDAESYPLPERYGPPNPRPSRSPFTAGYKAQGGPTGYMRGGYPEVYGAQRLPVRHTFDSGGANFVDRGYSQQSGRADDVNAKLSPMEYVMDAESMALLGDGNPEHGAKKMDQMRANLRKQKGRALAQGKFSPKAKSAQEYLVGNPMGDGLRRRGRDKG